MSLPTCTAHTDLAVEVAQVRTTVEGMASEQREMRADVSATREDVAALKATAPKPPPADWLGHVQRLWPVLLILAALAAVGLDVVGRDSEARQLREQIARVERLTTPVSAPVRDGGPR